MLHLVYLRNLRKRVDVGNLRSLTLPEEESTENRPRALVAPVFAQHVRGVDLTRNKVKADKLGSNSFTNAVKGKSDVPFVKF